MSTATAERRNPSAAPATTAPTPRISAEREQRRRRVDHSPMGRTPLALPAELDRNYVYRWVVDNPGRVQQLTVHDDYDPVTYEMLGMRPDDRDSNPGDTVTRIADKATGKRTLLLRKRRDYYDADKAREQQQIDRTMDALKHGAVPNSSGGRGLTAQDGAYVDGHRIDDGRRG